MNGLKDSELCFCPIEHPKGATVQSEFCPLHGTHPLTYGEALRTREDWHAAIDHGSRPSDA